MQGIALELINKITNFKYIIMKKEMELNAFDILKYEYPKEFKKVYKNLSYQMFYAEAQILLDVLRGRRDFGDPMGYDSRCAYKFMAVLNLVEIV